ncbi:hypothetical protein [Bacillus sp. FJAT-44742]|nr:hypothetical protein [Bacillus sp. FJAT-44742]
MKFSEVEEIERPPEEKNCKPEVTKNTSFLAFPIGSVKGECFSQVTLL